MIRSNQEGVVEKPTVSDDHRNERRSYRSPTLVALGTVRDVTQGSSGSVAEPVSGKVSSPTSVPG
jgi:hypothetical protein